MEKYSMTNKKLVNSHHDFDIFITNNKKIICNVFELNV
jgi:hypothetical protein